MSDPTRDEPKPSGREVERRAQRAEAPAPVDLAFVDDLTGLPNRRFVNRLLEDDWPSLVERQAVLSLILIDLDGFKAVNDTYGHAAGDEVLRVVARLLREHFRQGDVVARQGGDEFLVVLPGAGQALAAPLVARARAAVDSHSFSLAEGGARIAVPLSFSMGLASFPADGTSGSEILQLADRRLYEEKRGRTPRRGRPRRGLIALLGLALAGLLAGGLGVLFWPRPPAAEAPPQRAPRRTVAVLGFKNLSGRDEAAWLSTAFAEMLSAELAAVETLRVIPGESVARARVDLTLPESDDLAADTLRRVRARLGSDVVVVGSYLEVPGRESDRVRLDVRLQDAALGQAIAVVSQTGTSAELLELVARTGVLLRQALGAPPLAASAAAALDAERPGTTEAARLYAEGLDRLRLFDAIHARELLERAAAADPSWPLPHSALAEAWLALGYDGRAAEAAKRAFEMSAKLPSEERLLVEARFRETAAEWDAAQRINRALWRLAPDNVDYGLALARVQHQAGKEADSLATLATLRRLPAPLSNDPRIDLAEAEAAHDFPLTQAAAARAAARARAQGARLFLARARLLEAWALGELGRYVEATAAAQEARRIYEETGDRGGLARALNRIATVRPNQDDLVAARALFEQAARMAREVGDRRWTALVLNNLALTYSDSGDFAGAKPHYEEALSLAREVGSRRTVTIVVTNLGRDLNNLGRPTQARKLLEEALSGYRALGDRGSEVYALNNLGNSAMSLGELDQAQQLFEQALPLSVASGEKRIRAYTLLDLGEVQLWRGNLQAARKRFEEGLALRRELDVKLDIADSQLILARLALAEGEPRRAEALAREAAVVFEKEKSDAGSWANALVAQALADQGRGAEAVRVLAPAVAAAAHIQHAQIRLVVRTVEGRVLLATGRNAEALSRLQANLASAPGQAQVPEALEARLALAEARLRLGQREAGRAELTALVQEAEKLGFGLVARRAGAVP